MVAIIPAAGLGKRMRATTGGQPKELLPLGSKSVLERVIAEAQDAGVDQIVVVGSAQKPAIDRFVESLGEPRICMVHQEVPLGLADAVASPGTRESSLVMMGDTVFAGGSPCGRLLRALNEGYVATIAVQEVAPDQVRHYGIVEPMGRSNDIVKIVEKPAPEAAPSRWAVAARYALAREAMEALVVQAMLHREARHERELTLTDVLNFALNGADGPDGQLPRMLMVPLQGAERRVDCGSPEEYTAASHLIWD